MNFFYWVMGWVAQQSDKMSRQSVNFIPMNWLLIVAGPLLGMALVFSSKDTRHYLWAVPLAVVVCLFAALLLVSWFLRNVIFQKQAGAPTLGGAPVKPFSGPLVFHQARLCPPRPSGLARFARAASGRFRQGPSNRHRKLGENNGGRPSPGFARRGRSWRLDRDVGDPGQKTLLLYEANVNDDALRALGTTI